ncbi:hypothetical protein [Sphingomonas sp.]|nr:hypothetical protein [Sphingomonas sp.]
MADPVEHVTTTEARAGSSTDVNRYPLYIGLAMVVVIFAVILVIFR